MDEKKIGLVVFDMAGTTIEDRGEVLRAFTGAMEKNRIPIDEDFIRERRGASKREVFRQCIETHFGKADPENPHRVEQAYDDFRGILEGLFAAKGIRPIEGAEDVFRWLRKEGMKIALTTGFYRRVTDIILCTVGWNAGMVDASLCSDDVARGRPAPYMIFRAMEATGVVSVQKVVNVGDTALDLLSAANAGVRGNVGVLSGSQKGDQLSRVQHTHIISSVAELPALLEKAFL